MGSGVTHSPYSMQYKIKNPFIDRTLIVSREAKDEYLKQGWIVVEKLEPFEIKSNFTSFYRNTSFNNEPRVPEQVCEPEGVKTLDWVVEPVEKKKRGRKKKNVLD